MRGTATAGNGHVAPAVVDTAAADHVVAQA
jgi:hypothetical protein